MTQAIDTLAIGQFLSTFEANANSGDMAASAAQFADNFIAAGPDGAKTVHASDFPKALEMRKKFFDKAGCKSSKLISQKQTGIGDRYVLVDTRWQMDFEPEGKPAASIETGSAILLDIGGAEPKILLYAAHQDIFKRMRELDLLPSC